MPPEDEKYLTPGGAARILHVSPKTVNRWAHEGRIPCIVTLGGHRRFRLDDVQAVAEQMAGRGKQLAAEPPKAAESQPALSRKPKARTTSRRRQG